MDQLHQYLICTLRTAMISLSPMACGSYNIAEIATRRFWPHHDVTSDIGRAAAFSIPCCRDFDFARSPLAPFGCTMTLAALPLF
mmetsp:Transcript_16120/g.44572  ORF Transcript_16120/g.44572 Transcript_16120/m.44572 type:complete len:84 (-) Transcript_16120:146-397(-)